MPKIISNLSDFKPETQKLINDMQFQIAQIANEARAKISAEEKCPISISIRVRTERVRDK